MVLVVSPRQLEVIELTARGLPETEIGVELGVSDQTVKNHRSAVMKTLGARNSAHLVAISAAYRLINPRAVLGIKSRPAVRVARRVRGGHLSEGFGAGARRSGPDDNS